VAVVTDEMESGRRDVHHEAGEELGRVEGLAAASRRPLVAVEGNSRFEAEALDGQRWPQQIAGKSLETVVVFGLDRDRMVNRETSVTGLPRVQELDPIVIAPPTTP